MFQWLELGIYWAADRCTLGRTGRSAKT